MLLTAGVAEVAVHLFDHLGDVITGSVGALVISAAVRALPVPEPMGSKFYQWFYVFTQNVFINFDKSAQANRRIDIVERATDQYVKKVVTDQEPRA